MTGEPLAGGRAEADAGAEPGVATRSDPGAGNASPAGAGQPPAAPAATGPAPAARPGGTPGGPDGPAADPGEDTSARSGNGSFLRELPVLVVIALLLALLIKAFLVQAFYIPSGSMEQTLQIGDRVLVNKLVYRFRDIRRGEVVVFDGRTSSFQPEVVLAEPTNPVQSVLRGVAGALGLGATGERDFIKRVIGLPGDTVSCCDEAGRISVNGEVLDEPYLYEDDQRPFGPVTVPEGRIFVLGDHRSASQDSRAYLANPDIGSVSVDRVIGRAFVVVWPLSSADVLQRPDTFDEVPPPATGGVPADLPPVQGAPAPAAAAAALAVAPLALGATAAVPVRLAGRRALRAVRRLPRAGDRP